MQHNTPHTLQTMCILRRKYMFTITFLKIEKGAFLLFKNAFEIINCLEMFSSIIFSAVLFFCYICFIVGEYSMFVAVRRKLILLCFLQGNIFPLILACMADLHQVQVCLLRKFSFDKTRSKWS